MKTIILYYFTIFSSEIHMMFTFLWVGYRMVGVIWSIFIWMSEKKTNSWLQNSFNCKTEVVWCSGFAVVSSVKSVALAIKMLGFEVIYSW